jgi:tripartite-type tricarboxylate transporter receptor subunit TctC
MLHRRSLLAAPALLFAAPLGAQGVWNPQRPIRILVGFARAAGTDITTRTLTNKLQALLGQPIIVENRPGAGGNLASEATVNSPSDGYTLMMGTIASLVLNPILAKLPFDVVTDLTPISRSVEVTNILVVPMDRPWRSLAELIAAAACAAGSIDLWVIGGRQRGAFGRRLA